MQARTWPSHAGPRHASACATADNYNRWGEVEDSRQWCRAGGVILLPA